MERDWYQKQVEAAKREIEQWPDWMIKNVQQGTSNRCIHCGRQHAAAK